MRSYFEAEMRLLHEAAQEFSRAYPEQAGMLNLQEVKDRDPYVERLLEGMAFLTAQIRQRIDDDIPEISEALLNQLWPHFLRPFPSACIMKFAPRQGQLQQSCRIPRETVLLSPPVGEEKVICRFRTTTDVALHPLRLSRIALEDSDRGGTLLRMVFHLDAGVFAETLQFGSLPFYLHADPLVALNLYHLLLTDVAHVKVAFPEEQMAPPEYLGGQESVRPAHLATEDLLTPLSGRSFYGFHLLQDYFSFREKYLFVTLNGLNKVAWPRHCQSFELNIHLKGRGIREFPLRQDYFQLHCTPAVNLYAATSDPVRLSPYRDEYPLVADSAAREGVAIYSVDEAVGTNPSTNRRHPYHAVHHFRYRGADRRTFQVFRQEKGNGTTLTLRVGMPSGSDHETLSCGITATNGFYPRRFLQEGMINVPTPEIPSSVSFRNLARPGKMLLPPQRADFRLALISHLGINYSTLSSAETFKQMLFLYDWSGQEQNLLRIEGIRSIKVTPVDRLQKGALMRGLLIEMTVEEANYVSSADIYLFGLVLHQFLRMYASINTFVETRIYCHPSRKVFSWQPVFGEHLPL